MRRYPSKVDFCRRRSAQRLARSAVRVVEGPQFDLLLKVLSDQRAQQLQAEGVFQCPPEPLDQGDHKELGGPKGGRRIDRAISTEITGRSQATTPERTNEKPPLAAECLSGRSRSGFRLCGWSGF